MIESMKRHPYTKGTADMATIDRYPMVIPADWVPGPKQGDWTYNHYAALPDDGQRYEIVNGVLVMVPAPSWFHQEVAGAFYRHLHDYLVSNGLGGAFTSPIDVELTPSNMFQPDVVVLLKASREKLHEQHIVGAPDLVVEVASPGTRAVDRLSKYEAYARAGVPEYWIANPETKTIEVLVLEAGKYHSLGVFREKATLPSRIVPGFSVPVEQFFVSVWL
jgi:Uma2 family endonuclease